MTIPCKSIKYVSIGTKNVKIFQMHQDENHIKHWASPQFFNRQMGSWDSISQATHLFSPITSLPCTVTNEKMFGIAIC
jgi:hypothetical protein